MNRYAERAARPELAGRAEFFEHARLEFTELPACLAASVAATRRRSPISDATDSHKEP